MSVSRRISLPLFLTAALLVGCGGKFKDDSKVLASVNGEKITEQDFDNYLQLRQAQQAPIPDKTQEHKIVLDELIDLVVLSQRGAELGYENNVDVHFRIKRVREYILAQEVKRNAAKDMQITDEDVKKRFEQEVEKMHKTEYKARHILVKTEEEAKEVEKRLKAGMPFEQLAKTRSTDPGSASHGGELGWINQSAGFVPEFFTALTEMKKGQVSAPVKSEYGWHVIKVDDTRAWKLPTFDEWMADPTGPRGMREGMKQERVQAMLKELKEKAKVTVN